jgi:hypothetical protein
MEPTPNSLEVIHCKLISVRRRTLQSMQQYMKFKMRKDQKLCVQKQDHYAILFGQNENNRKIPAIRKYL